MTPDTLDRLARLRLRSDARPPFRRKLDDDGAGIAVAVPHPKDLAHALGSLTPRTLYRSGSSGVLREDGTAVDLTQVAGALVDEWAALPHREDAGTVYRDLRSLAQISPKRAALEYASAVVAAWRLSLPRPPRSRPKREARQVAKTVSERVQEHRTRKALDEDASGRWWLDGYLSGWGDDDEAPAPGTTVPRTSLYAMAREQLTDLVAEYEEDVSSPAPGSPSWFYSLAERLEEWAERAADEDLPLRPRVPGSRRFYSLADEALGGSREIRSRQHVYTIPNRGGSSNMTNALGDAVTREIARLVLEENREGLESYWSRLIEERDAAERRGSAPHGSGQVVDLAAHRRSV